MTAAASRTAIVAFANRLPVRHVAHGWRPAPGGLVAALRPALDGRSTWIGWDAGGHGVPSRIDGIEAKLVGVDLTRAQVEGSYHGFANRTLWPLLHGVVEPPVFDPRWWRHYRAANRCFADADPGRAGVRWVHDYQLLLVPSLLREAGVAAPIGLFLHVPFPSPEVFMRLPWRQQILEGMLGADVVSFHTRSYRDNFLGTCARTLHDVRVDGSSVVLADRRVVRTEANPISIDAGGLLREAAADGVERRVAGLRRQFSGRTVLLGVDRLDHTKGLPERLRALELLLEHDRRLRRTLTFIQVAVPSRGEIREYDELRREVEGLVGRINGRFTQPRGHVPIHYLFRGVTRDQLLAYYRLADVCLVTPLADGMNLVAKEFVVAQHAGEEAGALVLSEFAGAIDELPAALPCNPFDVEGLAGTIGLALELPEDDRRRRIGEMAATVAANDVHAWVGRELRALGVG